MFSTRSQEEYMTHRSRHFLSGGVFAVLLATLTGLALSVPAAFAAPPEAPVTEAATGVSAAEATLHGELNPGASATTGYQFAYNTNGTCTDGPLTEPQPEQTGEAIKVESLLTGLVPSTEYTFCVLATHLEGETTETTSGAPLSFKTDGLAPEVVSESASEASSSGASVHAEVNPENQATTSCVFEYGQTSSYGGSVPCEPGALEGFGAQSVSHPLAGLQATTVYHYRVVVENATGKTEGPDQEFTTLGMPIVTTGAPGALSRTTATISGGTINPQGAETTYHFAFSDQAAYEAKVAESAANPYVAVVGAHDLSAGSDYTSHVVAGMTITELHPGTTYHYALVATNSVGTTVGPDTVFTTSPPTPPVASTGGTEGVSWNEATITGSVDTRGLPTTIEFELDTTPGSGTLTAAEPAFAESGTVAVSAHARPYLLPNTTYYYRTLATNTDGTSIGMEGSFTTGAFPGSPGATPPPVQLVAFPGFVVAELAAGTPRTTGSITPKPLTKAQKRAKALRACNRKPKRQRAACRRYARKRYS
jgi:hypothetical protein